MKRIDDQWRPHDETYLPSRHTKLELVDHFLCHHVALLDFGVVDAYTTHDDGCREKYAHHGMHPADHDRKVRLVYTAGIIAYGTEGSNPCATGQSMTDSTDLKKAGLKATLPRLKILSILEGAPNPHMSAEDVYKGLLELGEEVGLATVYRVLTQFETAGLVIRHNFEGGCSVFELNHGEHHDHMVCVECGKVFEFFDKSIEQRQRKVAQLAGFIVDDHAHYLYGVCDGMRKRGKCSKN